MLWRSLGDAVPVSASLAEDGRAELVYPDRRESRSWPSFELLGTAPAGGEPGITVRGYRASGQRAGMPAQLTRSLGGSVSAVSAAPSGRAAALWTAQRYPPWYRVVTWSGSGSRHAMTPETVRIAGAPRWSPGGELAVAAFDGLRRGIMLIGPEDGAARWWSVPPPRATGCWRWAGVRATASLSGRIVTDQRGSSAPGRGVLTNRCACSGAPTRPRSRLSPGAMTGRSCEGLLALPSAAGPHPLLVFLHGGPVGALACGEHPDPSPWVTAGWAVFMPEFRSSGIAGPGEMGRAFGNRGLPGMDPEIGDVLAGVDLLTSRGVADPGALILRRPQLRRLPGRPGHRPGPSLPGGRVL